MGLGPYPAVSLASARDLARKAYDLIRNGQDPIDERQAKIDAQTVDSSTGMTFKRAAEQFIAAHESGWSNAKHRLQWVSTIGTYALPVIGALQVDQVEQRHILQILEPIWKPDAAAGPLAAALEKFNAVMNKVIGSDKPVTPPAVEKHRAQAPDIAAALTAMQDMAQAFSGQQAKDAKALADLEGKFAQLETAHKALVTKLSNESGDPQRPAASGGDGYEQAAF